MFFKNHCIDPGASEQKAQHEAGRTAPYDAAAAGDDGLGLIHGLPLCKRPSVFYSFSDPTQSSGNGLAEVEKDEFGTSSAILKKLNKHHRKGEEKVKITR